MHARVGDAVRQAPGLFPAIVGASVQRMVMTALPHLLCRPSTKYLLCTDLVKRRRHDASAPLDLISPVDSTWAACYDWRLTRAALGDGL